MAAEYIEVHPENPQGRRMKRIIEILKEGGLIIYPTDTVYGLGCDITNNRAVERICRIKGIKPKKANFSFICEDLSNISEYTKPFSTRVYKAMKKHFPGPFTFILDASSTVPKMLKNKKKTVGIRVPNTPIVHDLIKGLGNPIMSTSVKKEDDDITPYPTDPKEIFEEYQHLVDVVIDGGFGNDGVSTVIDCTSGECEIVRQGIGEFIL